MLIHRPEGGEKASKTPADECLCPSHSLSERFLDTSRLAGVEHHERAALLSQTYLYSVNIRIKQVIIFKVYQRQEMSLTRTMSCKDEHGNRIGNVQVPIIQQCHNVITTCIDGLGLEFLVESLPEQ